jgi:hypothetical protein
VITFSKYSGAIFNSCIIGSLLKQLVPGVFGLFVEVQLGTSLSQLLLRCKSAEKITYNVASEARKGRKIGLFSFNSPYPPINGQSQSH